VGKALKAGAVVVFDALEVKKGGVVVDVKSMIEPASVPAGISYWCL
jgi:hypothetical protein